MSQDIPTFEDASDSEERHRARLRQQISTTSSRLSAFTERLVSGAEAASERHDLRLQQTKDALKGLNGELQSQLNLLGKASKLENAEDEALFEETRRNIPVLWHEYQQIAFILVAAKGETKKKRPSPGGSS